MIFCNKKPHYKIDDIIITVGFRKMMKGANGYNPIS